MYTITDQQRDTVIAMVIAGRSCRQIVAQTGHAKNTVMRYRDHVRATIKVKCACGLDAKHSGWCAPRLRDSTERQKIVRNWCNNVCIDCGGPRHYLSGMRCKACWRKRVERRAVERAERMRPCRICETPHLRRLHGKTVKTCGAVWCERIYAFYYVEGRNRPPSVRGGKNNGLRFEYFLSDYIRRLADGS